MRYRYILLTVLFFSIVVFVHNRAYGRKYIDTSDVVDDTVKEDVPPILDPNYRHQKQHQLEINPYGGSYLGNTVGQTWNAGLRTYFHLSNSTALGLNFSYSRLLTDRSSVFGASLNDNNLYTFMAETMLSNDAALRIGNKLIEFDLFGTFGVGAIRINNQWEPAGQIGGGVKVYPGIRWLAFRIDLTNYAHFTPKPGDDQFDFDVLFLGGVSFLFPVKNPPYER